MGIYECLLKIYSVIDTVTLPVKLYVDMGVDVDAEQTEKPLVVYPNPSSDRFFIDAAISEGTILYEISDISGRVVWQFMAEAGNKIVWAPDKGISHGVYVLRMVSDGKSITQKLIYR